jgi:transposase
VHTDSRPQPPKPACLEEAHRVIARLFERIQLAEWQIAQLKKQHFGPSSDQLPAAQENLSAEQGLLDILAEPSAPPATADVVLPETPAQSNAKRAARHPQPNVVESVMERIEPADKVCEHCGKPKREIGCEKSERYEFVPAKLVRHEIVRPKYACPCGEGKVVIAPAPAVVIDKGLADASLVAQVVLAKYVDHLPLFRQQQQFLRLGVNLARTTLCGWVEKAAQWLQPVVREMKRELLSADYLQVDETPVRMLDPEVQGKTVKGHLWVLGQPGGDVIFEFHRGRGAEEARQVLGSFRGYLQRDGYASYATLANAPNSGLIPCGCVAHGRRKFVEALVDEPEQARWFVQQIGKLYVIEAHARSEGLRPEQRLKLRQELAPPIWAQLKVRLDEVRSSNILPQSPLAKAVRYAINEWDAWQRYLQDGRLEIDNNLIENAIRPTAVGKKNYLFIGHPDAGWRSAVIYSVVVSCKRRNIDPWAYLKDVFTRLPPAKIQDIANFVPARWKPATT